MAAEAVMVRLEELGVGVWAGLGERVTRWIMLIMIIIIDLIIIIIIISL